jgi:drug/metabolite transporter (DMT)-like permease
MNQLYESSLDMIGLRFDAGSVGPSLVLVSAACFGAMAIFGKLAYAAGVSAEALLLLRFAMAAALMGMVLVCRPELRIRRPADGPASQRGRATRRLVLVSLGLGAVGYATQSTLFFSALQRTDASLVALVLYTYPVLVTLSAAILGRDHLTTARCTAMVIASVGTVLVLLGAGGSGFEGVGVLLAFGAAVTYTAYILVADTVVNRVPPVVLATLVMTGAALILGARAVVSGGIDLRFRPSGWLWIGCIAAVSTVMAMLAFFAGLRRTGPSTASILSTFEPVVTTGLAALTLHEVLTPVQIAGALLVLSSVAVIQLRPRSERILLAGRDTGLNDRRSGRCERPEVIPTGVEPAIASEGDPTAERPLHPGRCRVCQDR